MLRLAQLELLSELAVAVAGELTVDVCVDARLRLLGLLVLREPPCRRVLDARVQRVLLRA